MTLTGIRRSLLVMAGFILIVVIGSMIWFGEGLNINIISVMIIIATLMSINAEIVKRVEERLSNLEDKLKRL